MAASVDFNRDASQGSKHYQEKYYSQEYLYVKITYPKLFRGVYLFPGGSTYLLVNKYCGSSYFPVNSYWGILFSREYLLTVAPVLRSLLEFTDQCVFSLIVFSLEVFVHQYVYINITVNARAISEPICH